jgi:hypothetical protein
MSIELIDCSSRAACSCCNNNSVTAFNWGAMSSGMTVSVVVGVGLGHREGSGAQERNLGELHCEEVDSCSMNRLKDCQASQRLWATDFALEYSTNVILRL